jgi:hypothetical protein
VDKIQLALTKISANFTEDFNTGDLKDAKALLDELCSQNDLLRVQLRSPTPRQCVHVYGAASQRQLKESAPPPLALHGNCLRIS